jgi:transposase-like protein
MKTRHVYPQKFREEAVCRYRQGGITHRQLAEELGVNVYTLRAWIWYRERAASRRAASQKPATTAAGAAAPHGSSAAIAADAAMAALRAEAEALRQQNQALQQYIQRTL